MTELIIAAAIWKATIVYWAIKLAWRSHDQRTDRDG